MARVKAAAIQIAPDLSGCAGTVDRVVSSIEEASRQDVEIAVFPETFVPYYPYFSFVLPPALAGKEHMRLYEEAVEVPGPVTETFAEAARRHGMVLVIGVNERQRGTLYNCQLIFDADGTLVLKRRKITPSYHERMIWGRGDGSGLRVAKTKVGRIGALACWEHYNPLARFSLMAQHEEIHCAHFPGSMVGPIFADQIESTIRHHALESGCFVINSTGWLTQEQIASITPDTKLQKTLQAGCMTTIISPEGAHMTTPIKEGEGMAVAELDFSLITKRKRMLDSVGHYARPDLFQLQVNRSEQGHASFRDESMQPFETPANAETPPQAKTAAAAYDEFDTTK